MISFIDRWNFHRRGPADLGWPSFAGSDGWPAGTVRCGSLTGADQRRKSRRRERCAEGRLAARWRLADQAPVALTD